MTVIIRPQSAGYVSAIVCVGLRFSATAVRSHIDLGQIRDMIHQGLFFS